METLSPPLDPHTLPLPEGDDVAQALQLAEALADGPMFRDAMIILFVLRGHILGTEDPQPPATNADREAYLLPIDRFLGLLGVPDHASLRSVWKQAEDLGAHREALFDAIEGLLRAVRGGCRLPAPPPSPSPSPPSPSPALSESPR
jgi:hypothetical protein